MQEETQNKKTYQSSTNYCDTALFPILHDFLVLHLTLKVMTSKLKAVLFSISIYTYLVHYKRFTWSATRLMVCHSAKWDTVGLIELKASA